MKIFKFCKDEEEFLLNNCNFTDDEKKVFEYKQKDYTIVKISMLMNMSERNINRIVSNIIDKIIRTLIIKAIKINRS